MDTMLYFGIIMAVFGLAVTIYTRVKMKKPAAFNDSERPSLSAIVQTNRLKSWSVISMVLLITGLVLILVRVC